MTRRSVEELADRVCEQLWWLKFSGGGGWFTDYDPLVMVMYRVAEEIEKRGGHLDKRKARKVWVEAMRMLQDSMHLDQNPWIPCRTCYQAFQPVIDESLLVLFLPWYRRCGDAQLLIAIHKCPLCGGKIKVEKTKVYKGDFHTPEPRSIDNDEGWLDELLSHQHF